MSDCHYFFLSDFLSAISLLVNCLAHTKTLSLFRLVRPSTQLFSGQLYLNTALTRDVGCDLTNIWQLIDHIPMDNVKNPFVYSFVCLNL